MEPRDLSHMDSGQSGLGSLLGIVRLIGAGAVMMIATVGVLVVLDVLPQSVLSGVAMKTMLVAAIAAAATAVVSLLVPGTRG